MTKLHPYRGVYKIPIKKTNRKVPYSQYDIMLGVNGGGNVYSDYKGILVTDITRVPENQWEDMVAIGETEFYTLGNEPMTFNTLEDKLSRWQRIKRKVKR